MKKLMKGNPNARIDMNFDALSPDAKDEEEGDDLNETDEHPIDHNTTANDVIDATIAHSGANQIAPNVTMPNLVLTGQPMSHQTSVAPPGQPQSPWNMTMPHMGPNHGSHQNPNQHHQATGHHVSPHSMGYLDGANIVEMIANSRATMEAGGAPHIKVEMPPGLDMTQQGVVAMQHHLGIRPNIMHANPNNQNPDWYHAKGGLPAHLLPTGHNLAL